MRKSILFYALVISLSCACAHAAIEFNIIPTDTSMGVGGDVTLTISIRDDAASTGFGVVEWGFDMWVDGSSTGAVEIVSASVLNDSFYFYTDVSGQNTVSGLGSVTMGTAQFGDPVSNIGISGFTDIAEVTIRGTAVGTVNYNLDSLTTPENFFGRSNGGDLQNADLYDGTDGLADPAVTSYSVVPEPSSLLILSGLGMIGYLRRKK